MQSLLQQKRLRQYVEQDIQEKTSRKGNANTSRPLQRESNLVTPDLEKGESEGTSQSRDSHHAQAPSPGADAGTDIDNFVEQTEGLRVKSKEEDGESRNFIVEAGGDGHLTDPLKWPKSERYKNFAIIWFIVFVVGYGSSASSSDIRRAADTYGVSGEAQTLSTALFLFGIALGALISGPISETIGRSMTYLGSLGIYLVCALIVATAPTYAVNIVFRFFCGFFASPTLTIYGGSLADMFDSQERSYMWPLFATSPLLGPIIAPIPSGWLENDLSICWQWVEWMVLITGGLGFIVALLFLKETHPDTLLTWKAQALRQVTGDDRFKSDHELSSSFLSSITENCKRPISFFTKEPIVIALGLYLTIIYVLVFSFLDGFTFIFADTYGFNPGQQGSTFGAITIGVLLQTAIQPYWAHRYNKLCRTQNKEDLDPEQRLYQALYSAPLLPISLFWLGWTNYLSISFWSNIGAAALFGFSLMGIFVSAYQYILDAYESMSSSALSSITFARYVVSGGVVIATRPMYDALGSHYTLTLLGGIAVLLTPLPFIFMKYGDKVRAKSEFIQQS